MPAPDLTAWPLEAIRQDIAQHLPRFTLEVVAEIDSTNAELMRRAHAGRKEPVLLVAQHQNAGRGRLGRQWHSYRDQAGATGWGSLMFSLGLPLSPKDWSGLSLAVGLSVAQSLHPAIRLKWPNDLWWHGRKLAGILIETTCWSDLTAQRYVVVGVGLNIACPPATGLSTPPAGLVELAGTVDAAQALRRIAAPLVATLQTFEQHGFAPFEPGFNARDALAQMAVTLSDGIAGIAQGVDRSGALLVQTDQGLQRVTSAEVSVRAQRRPDDSARPGY